MKTTVYCCIFTLVSFWSFVAFGQGTCHNNGGGYPGSGYPNGGDSYGQVDPYGAGVSAPSYPSQLPVTRVVPIPNLVDATVAPAGPAAKITVVSVNSAIASKSSIPSAKLTIVADDAAAASNGLQIAEEPVVDERIAQLAGTWKAVARRSEGELTTIELHLDNRGWAELTVPGSDGKPATTKSRVNLENEELKLTGSDKVVSLGRLVDVSTRQMVLERAEGQVTFVRL